MRIQSVGIAVTVLALAACDRETVAPPVNELDLANTLGAQAQTAMGGEASGPASILRSLVQQVRAGDNADAKLLLTRAEDLSRRAAATGDRELAAQAHGLVLQAVTLVFPNAALRLANVVRDGLEKARAGLGSRDAPRIRSVLDQVADLLRQSAAAQDIGRKAIALDLAIRASDILTQLVEHVRAA
jgi:hypothetical protein